MPIADDAFPPFPRIPLTDLPDAERPLDRDGLETLFLAGLTPADVAMRHAVSRRHVAALARRWGLDSRALRARPRSIAALRPDLAAEFVTEVGRSRNRDPSCFTLGSGQRCRWRCSQCEHEWEATVSNRAVHGSGCPRCAVTRIREAALADRARTPPLSVLRHELTAEFVRNVSVPHRDATSTPEGSHDRILWRCRNGHEWQATVGQRTRHRTSCPACRPGLRSSRLEYDVAELLMACTGLTVRVSHSEARGDRADVERIDLYVEELGLLVDLDPARWHKAAEAVQRDTRKLERLAGRRYVRVRSAALGRLDVQLPSNSLACQIVLEHGDDKDPEAWLTGLLPLISSLTDSAAPPSQLTAVQRDDALGRAARRWADLLHGPRPRSLLTEHPAIAAEFVEVRGR
jgi:hypothetical protein